MLNGDFVMMSSDDAHSTREERMHSTKERDFEIAPIIRLSSLNLVENADLAASRSII
jgi:hypothetical protein